MTAFFEMLLANALVATLLAAIVGLLSRFRLRPVVLHVLWLMVLLKFVTPPLVRLDLPVLGEWPLDANTAGETGRAPGEGDVRAAELAERSVEPARADSAIDVLPSRTTSANAPLGTAKAATIVPTIDETDGPPDMGTPAATPAEDEPVPARAASGLSEPLRVVSSALLPPARPLMDVAHEQESLRWQHSFGWQYSFGWQGVVATTWLAGSSLWFALAVVRLARFHRQLRRTRPAEGDLQRLAEDVAARLGLRHPPLIRVTEATLPPILVSLPRRGLVLLPSALLAGLSRSQQAAVIAHELAHFRRGDHYVRRLELLVLGLYWWHPAAWWACRQLRQAEELCCDAWVLRVFPDQAKGYAEALVTTLDFLAEVPALAPAGASGLGHFPPLQRRLEMILKPACPPRLSWLGRVALAALALGLLPWTPRAVSQDKVSKPTERAKAADTSPVTPELQAPPEAVPTTGQTDVKTKPSTEKPSTEERLDRLEAMLGKLLKVMEARSEAPAAGHTTKLPSGGEKNSAVLDQLKLKLSAMDREIEVLEKQLAKLRDDRLRLQDELKRVFPAAASGGHAEDTLRGAGSDSVLKGSADWGTDWGGSPRGLSYDLDKENGVLSAVDRQTGKVVWKTDLRPLGRARSLALERDRVIVTGEGSEEMTFDGRTGKVLSHTAPEKQSR